MTDAQKSSEASKSSSPLSAAQLNRLLNFAFIVGCLAVFVLITFANVAEPDIWGHTRFGEDILRLRQIPTADPYSYVNQGFFCIDHEWLFDVMMACWYQLSGVLGLVLFKGLLVAALVGLLILPLRQAGFGLFATATADPQPVRKAARCPRPGRAHHQRLGRDDRDGDRRPARA